MGNPKGLEGTFSVGNVRAIREIKGQQMVQITAPISPGSSGGPVVDAYGRAVGISTAQLEQGQNLNFAVPASHLVALMKEAGISVSGDSPSAVNSAKSSGRKPEGDYRTVTTIGNRDASARKQQARAPESVAAKKVDLSNLFPSASKESRQNSGKIDANTIQGWFVSHLSMSKQ